jgi:hypothetical protein
MEKLLIRCADVSEQKQLEALQWRASLTNEGDRDALLANPDAIELPVAQIAAGGVFVAEQNERLSDLRRSNPGRTGTASLMRCLSIRRCGVEGLRVP